MFKPVRQRLVRTHPVTGRKSLFLSSHIGTIVGWPVPEARAFIRDLTEHATQPQFVYSHKWRQYDLVMWDNRQTMHRVTRFDETPGARHAPHHGCRRCCDGGATGGIGSDLRRAAGVLPCIRIQPAAAALDPQLPHWPLSVMASSRRMRVRITGSSEIRITNPVVAGLEPAMTDSGKSVSRARLSCCLCLHAVHDAGGTADQ